MDSLRCLREKKKSYLLAQFMITNMRYFGVFLLILWYFPSFYSLVSSRQVFLTVIYNFCMLINIRLLSIYILESCCHNMVFLYYCCHTLGYYFPLCACVLRALPYCQSVPKTPWDDNDKYIYIYLSIYLSLSFSSWRRAIKLPTTSPDTDVVSHPTPTQSCGQVVTTPCNQVCVINHRAGPSTHVLHLITNLLPPH